MNLFVAMRVLGDRAITSASGSNRHIILGFQICELKEEKIEGRKGKKKHFFGMLNYGYLLGFPGRFLFFLGGLVVAEGGGGCPVVAGGCDGGGSGWCFSGLRWSSSTILK